MALVGSFSPASRFVHGMGSTWAHVHARALLRAARAGGATPARARPRRGRGHRDGARRRRRGRRGRRERRGHRRARPAGLPEVRDVVALGRRRARRVRRGARGRGAPRRAVPPRGVRRRARRVARTPPRSTSSRSRWAARRRWPRSRTTTTRATTTRARRGARTSGRCCRISARPCAGCAASRLACRTRCCGHLCTTDMWYVDTESQCFTRDLSMREAQLVGGVCADATGPARPRRRCA